MKKLYTFVSALLLSASLWAQAPQSFSYQAVIRGVNNELVANKPIGIRISMLQGSEVGNAVYVEKQTPNANSNGLVSINIGSGTVVTGTFSTIDWSKGPYFVKTEIDAAGGTNYALITTSQLLSVPYALYAANSQPGPKGEPGLQGPAGKDGVNGKDGKVEFQSLKVSVTGDTLYLTNGNFVIIPGVSLSNHKPTSGYGLNISDIDGNSYKTVYIGAQLWLAENLKVSKYNDGTTIPNVTANSSWNGLNTGAWSYYNNDIANNATHGRLYNWFSLSPTMNGNKNVCPIGWHVPTKIEWDTLINYLGGVNIAGGKMKEVGTTHWNAPNSNATNSSNFSALPSGIRDAWTGNCSFIGGIGFWWSSSINDASTSWKISTSSNDNTISIDSSTKQAGLSVRCLKD